MSSQAKTALKLCRFEWKIYRELDCLCQNTCLRKRTGQHRGKEAIFWIGKFDRKLDKIGGGRYCEWVHKINFGQVLQFPTFDLLHNNIFMLSSTVMRQRRGIAMGGTTSAQVASVYCATREHHFYSHVQPWAPNAILGRHHLFLPAQPIRFRDNIEGIKLCSKSLDTIKKSMENMYNLRLQQEGSGRVMPSLGAELRVQGPVGAQSIRL